MNHNHSSLEEITKLIWSLKLPDSVKQDIENVYKIIAEAESKAHNTEVSQIHFHEVGTKDAIMDIAAVCYLMYLIKPDKVIAGPVCTGKGYVRCSHGYLPVPTPATAYILEGIPTYQGDINGELCTPTGAALLKYFVDEFREQPEMKVERIGYGMGKKTFRKLNCVRAFLGETEEKTKDKVYLLECNIDDMTGEELGYATEVLLSHGALDVYATPVFMKKNRPGVILSVLVNADQKDKFVELIFKHTTTIGIRENDSKRYTLDRDIYTYKTALGPIRKKRAYGYNSQKEKFEFEDIKRVAEEKGISLLDAKELIRKLLEN